MNTGPSDDAELDGLLRRLPGAPDETDEAAGAHWDEEALLAARDGPPESPERERMEAHLLRCAACRAAARELARPLAPQVVERARAAMPGRRGLSVKAAPFLAGVLAAAAVLAVVLLRPGAVDSPPAFEVVDLRGATRQERGTGPEGATFLPDSVLRLDVGPAVPLDHAPAARVFASRGGGPMRAVPPERLRAGDDGAWRLEADAASLFGREPGAWTLEWAFAPTTADLPDAEGLTPPEAREATRSRPVRWLAVAVEYRLAPEGGGP